MLTHGIPYALAFYIIWISSMRWVVQSVYWLGFCLDNQKIGAPFTAGRPLFFVIFKTSSVVHPVPCPNGTRGSLSGKKVLEALKLRTHGALPPPRRMLRRPIASRITLHLTWYLCITFTHPPAQKTLECSTLEPAGSSETPQITYQKYVMPHSKTQ